MYICFIDESGCTGELKSTNLGKLQPVFAIAALFIKTTAICNITTKWLKLKRKYFPAKSDPDWPLNDILWEIKGADLRKALRSKSRNKKRHTIRFLDQALSLLSQNGAKLVTRVYVKGIDEPFDGKAVYTTSIQKICEAFNSFLVEKNDKGIVLADSRWQNQDAIVSHSVFTQKFGVGKDIYPRIFELPMFGHSQNHAGIQLADLVVSSLLFPLATYSYCLGEYKSIHISGKYKILKDRFASWLQQAQYRYKGKDKRWRGGVTIIDKLKCSRSANVMLT